jgi:hypothetical protein
MIVIASFPSCTNSSSKASDLKQEITKRLEILTSSYKFQIIPINLQGKVFDSLVSQISDLSEANSKKDFQEYYLSIHESFSKYNITIPDNPRTKDDFLINTLMGLDSLIFRYIPSRLNYSDYKMIVVPNTSNLKVGETLNAKIYLTVSDTLYEPEFISGDFRLPSENGVGQYNLRAGSAGTRKIEGKAVYSNEFGSKDTLIWSYEFNVK